CSLLILKYLIPPGPHPPTSTSHLHTPSSPSPLPSPSLPFPFPIPFPTTPLSPPCPCSNLASNRLSGTANWDFTNAAIKGGEVNVRSNYFYGTPSFTAAGKPFCPITKTSKMNGLDQIFLSSSKFNCFTFPAKYPCPGFNEPGYSSPAVCRGFCGASSPQGTCNGLGYCSKTSTVVGGWGCVCDAGATLAPNGTWCLPGKSSTYGQKSMTFLRG
ncbi:unnamed protein product, partial [Closterium sp. Naga37s-1]